MIIIIRLSPFRKKLIAISIIHDTQILIFHENFEGGSILDNVSLRISISISIIIIIIISISISITQIEQQFLFELKEWVGFISINDPLTITITRIICRSIIF